MFLRLQAFLQQVRPTALGLMLLLLALIVIYYVRYGQEMAPRMGTLEWIKNYDKPRLSLDGRRYKVERKDFMPLAILMAVYAVATFSGLGSTEAPQSFYHFTEENYSVELDLGDTKDISSVMYYTGLYPGDYDFYYWDEPEAKWVRLVNPQAQPDEYGNPNDFSMPQSYADLYKWLYVKMDQAPIRTRYIQIFARSFPMELGEMAFLGADGTLLELSVDSALMDEQDTVPDKPSYMNSMYFDEIYHGRTAYEYLHAVYPYEITHPPLGKLLIALGVELFGMTPFGYRFMGAFFGVLMLLPMYLLIKQMFGKTQVAFCGTTVFAFEFMHFTQTRIATIDTYSVFFTLGAFYFMWRWISVPYDWGLKKTWPDLALSGLMFGLGAASKWTVLYAGVGLAALWLLRVSLKYRSRGLGAYGLELLGTIGLSCLFFVAVPLLVYCLSYIPYLYTLGKTTAGTVLRPDSLRMIWDNQTYMLSYHAGVDATHPYSSRWYQWVFDLRPILYYLDYGEYGAKSAIGAFNSPLVSWAGLGALIAMIPAFYQKRRPASLLIWAGYLCQLLPWVFISRTTFAYHYFGCSAFLVLAIASVCSDLIDRAQRNEYWVYGFTGLEVGLFTLFYPVLSGAESTVEHCLTFLKWLPGWPWG